MSTIKTERTETALKALRRILNAPGNDLRSLLYKDIILNALKYQQDKLDIGDLKVITGLWPNFGMLPVSFALIAISVKSQFSALLE
jgi:hypothetical protein